jgi:hypothetical protein
MFGLPCARRARRDLRRYPRVDFRRNPSRRCSELHRRREFIIAYHLVNRRSPKAHAGHDLFKWQQARPRIWGRFDGAGAFASRDHKRRLSLFSNIQGVPQRLAISDCLMRRRSTQANSIRGNVRGCVRTKRRNLVSRAGMRTPRKTGTSYAYRRRLNSRASVPTDIWTDALEGAAPINFILVLRSELMFCLSECPSRHSRRVADRSNNESPAKALGADARHAPDRPSIGTRSRARTSYKTSGASESELSISLCGNPII